MTRKQKKNLLRIIIALGLFIPAFIIDHIKGLDSFIDNKTYDILLPLGIYLVIYFIIGYDVLLKSIKNICRGSFLDENFLMSIATIGALAIGDFSEAVAVFIFYQIGEWFQDYALGKSRKSISALMDIRPDYANLVIEDNKEKTVDPSEVKVNDIIVVKPGEKIPLDGIIVEGASTIDTKALTGESLPVDVSKDSNVISGTINLTSKLYVKVLKTYSDSTVAKILDLVENASSKKSKSENFISKFAKWYTPIVVIGALLVFILGGLISTEWIDWLKRSLNFLVISCPCALVISIPLSFFAGIGGASRNGILVKGSVYLEKLNEANTFVFDKTGTLTKGTFEIIEIRPIENKEKILKLASLAEGSSNHPIARSIKEAYNKKIDTSYNILDIPGKGIKATKDKEVILCGNEKLMLDNNILYEKAKAIGTVVYVARNNEFIGSIVISDIIKPDALATIKTLNKHNSRTIMLTGDNETIASSVASELGLTDYRSSLLPQNKVEIVDELLKNQAPKDCLCFIGDGINDAPVLVSADIGIAMGALGSDAAIEASDIVLMNDDLNSIIIAKKIASKTVRIVKENIVFALGIKLLILALSVLGLANMWLAILADVGVAMIAIINAMRCNYKIKK